MKVKSEQNSETPLNPTEKGAPGVPTSQPVANDAFNAAKRLPYAPKQVQSRQTDTPSTLRQHPPPILILLRLLH